MLGSIFFIFFEKAAPAAVQSTSDTETGNESHFQLALIHIMDIIYFLWAHDRPDIDPVHSYACDQG